MSLQKIIKENNSIIALWKNEESLAELLRLMPHISVSHIKNEKRKKEYLSIRILLHKISPKSTLSYNNYNAPELDEKQFISISHSDDLLAIMLSSKRIGIDIEKISSKALQVSSKFILNNKHDELSKEKATLIWCCKEAIFKWYQKGGIDFKNDISLEKFHIKEKGKIKATLYNQKYTLNYTKLDNHFLVYVCK